MWGCIQKFPDWPPGARTANGTVLCHQIQLCRYFVSQSSEFCRRNPLCCVSTSVCCYKRIFRYRLSPKTFGYPRIHVLKSTSATRLRTAICVNAIRFTKCNKPTLKAVKYKHLQRICLGIVQKLDHNIPVLFTMPSQIMIHVFVFKFPAIKISLQMMSKSK